MVWFMLGVDILRVIQSCQVKVPPPLFSQIALIETGACAEGCRRRNRVRTAKICIELIIVNKYNFVSNLLKKSIIKLDPKDTF